MEEMMTATSSADETKAGLIEQIVALAQDKLPAQQAAPAVTFIRQYYRQVDVEDLQERSIDDLYGAALAHFHFARHFSSGAAKLRVYNPTLEEHGWQSSHTIIEIVNDDMPFLVDSITMEVNRQGLTLHLIIHPVMNLLRDAQGNLGDVPEGEGGRYESIMHVELDRRTDARTVEALSTGLLRILGQVRMAVADWEKMAARVRGIAENLGGVPPPLPHDAIAEGMAFLKWLANGNFTLLGARDYDLIDDDGPQLRIVPGSGLGVMRDDGEARTSRSFAQLPRAQRDLARKQVLMILTKGNARATVHRPGYVDYVGVKRFDAAGKVIGEHRIVGLYTSTAYHASPEQVPLLRRKFRHVVENSGLMPGSHMGKALITILESYPRDELFQSSREELFATVMGILRLGERQRTRLFVRRDEFGRFLSCLIYVPRERYNTELRGRMQQVLMQAFRGTGSEFTVQISESALARILLTVHTAAGGIPDYDVREIENRLAQAVRRWEDDLYDQLIAHAGEERGNELMLSFGRAFPAGYRENYSARAAVHDIDLAERAQSDDLQMSLYLPLEAPPGSLRIKVLRAGQPVPLSRSLPM